MSKWEWKTFKHECPMLLVILGVLAYLMIFPFGFDLLSQNNIWGYVIMVPWSIIAGLYMAARTGGKDVDW